MVSHVTLWILAITLVEEFYFIVFLNSEIYIFWGMLQTHKYETNVPFLGDNEFMRERLKRRKKKPMMEALLEA